MTRSNSIPKILAWAAAAFGAVVHLACAAVPLASPQTPSHVEAAEGVAADVTRALEEAPPLPGAAHTGWAGLQVPVAEDPHAAHRHGGRHVH